MDQEKKKRVVIIGSGFGGVYTAKYLMPLVRSGAIDLTIINRTNYFLFTPLLHEVATGGLSPMSVAESLREVFRNTDVKLIKSSVTKVDTDKRLVHSEYGELPYDYLVCAVGAETNFYNIPGAKEHSFTLKNLLEAALIRHRIIDLFEQAYATRNREEKMKLVSFLIVGGGATAVEFAAELAEFAQDTMAKYYCGESLPREAVSITLVTNTTELIEQFHPSLRQKALSVLNSKGVKIRFNTTVAAVTADGVTLKDNSSIPASAIIWLAGVRPVPPAFLGKVDLHASGRISVNEFLHVEGKPELFVLGDAAAHTTTPLPMLAQVAVAQAKAVAYNLRALIGGEPQRPFVYQSLGSLISVGQWMALGDLFGMQLSGRFMWWLWRTVYLFKFLSWRKRFKIAVEWTVNLFYPRDITKVI